MGLAPNQVANLADPSAGSVDPTEGQASPSPSDATPEPTGAPEGAPAGEPQTPPEGEGAEPQEAAEGAQPAEGEEPQAPATDEPPDKPVNEPTLTEEEKGFLRAHPKLRNDYFRGLAALEVVGTVADARKMAEFFPNGVEDAQAAIEGRDQLERIDGLLLSGTEEGAAQFLERVREFDAQSFERVAKAMPAYLAQHAPHVYREQARTNVGNFLARARQVAESRQDENAVNAVDVLASLYNLSLDGQPGQEAGPKDPRLAEIERKEQELAQREQQQQVQVLEGFIDRANDGAVKEILGAIDAQVDKLLPNYAEGLRRKISGEVYAELHRRQQANRDLTNQVRRQFREAYQLNDLSEDRQKKIAQFVVGRAKPLVPDVVKQVVGTWTKEYLAANGSRLEKQRTQASRQDIGSGGPARPSAPGEPPPPDKVDYRQTSDDDIMAGRWKLKK